ncbi:unnamed protein product, partial [Adineta ricciae]
SSTWNGAEKAIKQERISGKEYVADVAFGAATGVVTGGVGVAGETVAVNVVKQGAKEVAKAGAKKLAVRATTGAVVGLTSKAIDEVKQCSTADKKWRDYGKSFDRNGKPNGTTTAWVGSALGGGLGGVGSHVSSSLVTKMTSPVAESITRVLVSGTSAAVGDATIQTVSIAAGSQEQYDLQRTVTCATSSVIMATAQEATKNAIYRAQGGKAVMLNDKTNKKLIEENVPENHRKTVSKAYDDLKKIPQSTLADEAQKANEITKRQVQESKHQSTVAQYNQQIQLEIDAKNVAIDVKDELAIQKHASKMKSLIADKKAVMKAFKAAQPAHQRADIQYLNNQNVHFLVGDHVQQVAADIDSRPNEPRGATRALFDYHSDRQGNAEFRYADYTSKHDYNSMACHGAGDHRYNGIRTDYDNTLKSHNESLSSVSRNGILESGRNKKKDKKKSE